MEPLVLVMNQRFYKFRVKLSLVIDRPKTWELTYCPNIRYYYFMTSNYNVTNSRQRSLANTQQATSNKQQKLPATYYRVKYFSSFFNKNLKFFSIFSCGKKSMGQFLAFLYYWLSPLYLLPLRAS